METETDTQSTKSSKCPENLDYNDVELLSRHVTDTGKMLPRRITGLSAKQQRTLTKKIKQARNMLLMQ